MTGRTIATLLIGAAMGLMLFACTQQNQSANGQAPAKTQQWEYKITPLQGGTAEGEAALNNIGADGWEVCAFDAGQSSCISKRPKR